LTILGIISFTKVAMSYGKFTINYRSQFCYEHKRPYILDIFWGIQMEEEKQEDQT
jgi:hypothetical protein